MADGHVGVQEASEPTHYIDNEVLIRADGTVVHRQRVQVHGSIAIENFPTTQSVTGTINIGNFPAVQAVSGTVAVSNFPTSFTVNNTSLNPVPVTGTLAVSGTVEISNDVGNPIPISGTLTANQGGQWTVALDTASLTALETISATQSGAWTVALDAPSLTALENVAARQDGIWTVVLDATTLAALENVATRQDGAWTVALDTATLTALESIAVRQDGTWTVAVSNWPVTQPVSGTVTANQGGVWTVSVNNFPTTTEITNDVGNPVPVSGTVAVSNFPSDDNEATRHTELMAAVDGIEGLLAQIRDNSGSGAATEVTLESLRANFSTYRTNLEARDLATNATAVQIRDYLDTVETLISAQATNVQDDTRHTVLLAAVDGLEGLLITIRDNAAAEDFAQEAGQASRHTALIARLNQPLDSRQSGDWVTGLRVGPTPISPENPLPVDVQGDITVQNLSVVYESEVSTLNSTSTPLGANETFTGTWEDVRDFAAISVAVFTDAPSATNGASIDFSHDGVNVIRSVPTSIPANVGSHFSLAPQARYVRIRYTNGATPQTVMRSEVIYKFNPMSPVQQPIGATLSDLNLATVSQSTLKGRIMSGASTGGYAPIGTDGLGNLWVRDTNAATLLTSIRDYIDTVETLITAQPTEITEAARQTDLIAAVDDIETLLTDILTKLNATIATAQSGVWDVSINNLPATQPVSGSVEVSNFPATTEITNDTGNPIPVSGTISTVPAPTTTLTSRLRNSMIAEGYRLWMDTVDADYVYLAEAPAGAADYTTEVWRGIRIPKNAEGFVLGEIEESTAFRWDNKTSSVGWT